MLDIAFERNEDFDTELHRSYRDDAWLAGSYAEVPYFLSCVTRTNYIKAHHNVWEQAAKEFFSNHTSESAWITRSRCFHDFAVLILKQQYRESELGQRFPIRKESRTEWVARVAIAHSRLTIDALAKKLNTTLKQIERNSTAMLARREFARPNPEP